MSKVSFGHSADNHLGCYRIAGKSSWKREEDFYRVQEAFISECIKRKVDFAVASGDVFNYPGSRSHSLSVGAYNCLKRSADRLRDAGINYYLVGGNHDTMKYGDSSNHPLTILDGYDNVRVAYSKRIYVHEHKVLLLPWIWGEQFTASDWNQPDVDVCVAHAPMNTGRFSTGPRFFDVHKWGEAYPYIALGDWHMVLSIGNAHYPSAMERTTFGEVEQPTGAYFVDMEDGVVTNKEYWNSPSRSMEVIKITSEVDAELEYIYKNKDSEGIYRIIIPADLKVDADIMFKLRSKYPFLRIDFIFDENNDIDEEGLVGIFKQSGLPDRWLEYCRLKEIGQTTKELGSSLLELK